MSGFPNSFRLLIGGLVLITPASAELRSSVARQNDPDNISGCLQVLGSSEESMFRSATNRADLKWSANERQQPGRQIARPVYGGIGYE
jgi:hypothetical protein